MERKTITREEAEAWINGEGADYPYEDKAEIWLQSNSVEKNTEYYDLFMDLSGYGGAFVTYGTCWGDFFMLPEERIEGLTKINKVFKEKWATELGEMHLYWVMVDVMRLMDHLSQGGKLETYVTLAKYGRRK